MESPPSSPGLDMEALGRKRIAVIPSTDSLLLAVQDAGISGGYSGLLLLPCWCIIPQSCTA